jgi:hypothetical protein
MRPIRNVWTDRKNLKGSRSDRLVGFEKRGERSAVAVHPASLDPGETGHVDITVTGTKLSRRHLVVMLPPATLEAGLLAGATDVVADDSVRVTLTNTTGDTIDGAAHDWIAVLFRRRAT